MEELKVAVRYFSKSGNTKKLADVIAKTSGCKAKKMPAPLNDYVDVLFLGASVYWGGISSEVKKYIKSLDKRKVGRVVVFSTSALAQRALPQVEKCLKERNIKVDSKSFYCRGEFTALHKGRPNSNDLKAAAKFTKHVLEGK